jgi:superfamily II RNA helicase
MVKICDFEYPEENEEKYKEYYDIFPYNLNPFQKHSIEAICEGQHVLVTAHTGTGKSTCAEQAIMHFVKNGKKVIYTSPIKALSNQKYYDFTNKFPNISFSIFTGDIKLNPDADVIIMTTEILANNLFSYNKNDKIKSKLEFNIDIETELGCVIFDEVHFINDEERGNVWEKCFIMLPSHIQLVLLSATIDNPLGFAEWIESGRYGKEKKEDNNKIVYLTSTRQRIIPLMEYSYITTIENIFKGLKDKELEKFIRDNTNKLLLLNDSKNNFNEQTYNTISKMQNTFKNREIYMKPQNVLNNLMTHLKEKELFPAITFVFSRKQCEKIASEITTVLLEDDSKIPYTIRRECEQIIRKLPNFKEYLELPEYNFIVSLLEKGIAVHHSGLLPVIREMVELMITKKYIKLLIATESFSVGLNAPIKTCIFVSLTKYDNNGQRCLTSVEFGQMKGRSGRLGLDKVGTIIHLNNLFKLPTMTEYKQILSGKPQKLVSKFHISYPVILNLIKNGQFSEFHTFSEKSMMQNELTIIIKQKQKTIQELEEKVNKKRESMEFLKTPYDICLKYIHFEDTVKNLVNKKRKEAEREMKSIQDQYRSLTNDVKSVREISSVNIALNEEQNGLSYTETYIKQQTDKICEILIDKGFIKHFDGEELGNQSFTQTELGSIASSIAEIHPLIISEFMVSNNYFVEFSTKQLVGLFSCFTDVKIPSDQKTTLPNSEDSFLNQKIKLIQQMYVDYQKMEFQNDIQTGIKYDDELIFDIIDFSMKWCDCSNEQECKYFIQNDVAEKSISIGDFNKALLKIVTISRELSNVCEETGQIELLYKLTQIEGMILKYVTTNQSLYV